MKTIDDNKAQALMERFLAGETDIAQENELYRYFASGEVAPVLQQYRAMMDWYRSLSEADGKAADSPIASPRPPRGGWRRWRAWAAAAASVAVVAVVTTLAVTAISHSRNIDEEYLAYQGSYVIINGKKQTDLKQIMPQLKEGERLADSLSRVVASIKGRPNPVVAAISAYVPDSLMRQVVLENIFDNQL